MKSFNDLVLVSLEWRVRKRNQHKVQRSYNVQKVVYRVIQQVQTSCWTDVWAKRSVQMRNRSKSFCLCCGVQLICTFYLKCFCFLLSYFREPRSASLSCGIWTLGRCLTWQREDPERGKISHIDPWRTHTHTHTATFPFCPSPNPVAYWDPPVLAVIHRPLQS